MRILETLHQKRETVEIECNTIQTSSIEEYVSSCKSNGHLCIGIDPGIRKLGYTFMPHYTLHDITYTFEINLPQDKNHTTRFFNVWLAAQMVTGIFTEHSGLKNFSLLKICIEGAAYEKGFGQVALAEIRTVLASFYLFKGHFPYIIPPQTIRKSAFNSAKIKAKELWTELPPDSAASIGCALWANNELNHMMEFINE